VDVLVLAKAAPDKRRSSVDGRRALAATGSDASVGADTVLGNGASPIARTAASAESVESSVGTGLAGGAIGPSGGNAISACVRFARLACALWRARAGRAAA